MPMDDHPTRYSNSCLLDLEDSHGRIGVGSIFSSPSSNNILTKFFKELTKYKNDYQ